MRIKSTTLLSSRSSRIGRITLQKNQAGKCDGVTEHFWATRRVFAKLLRDPAEPALKLGIGTASRASVHTTNITPSQKSTMPGPLRSTVDRLDRPSAYYLGKVSHTFPSFMPRLPLSPLTHPCLEQEAQIPKRPR